MESAAASGPNETEAVGSFLKVVNDVIRGNESNNQMSEKTALKFLISRKFDVQRALQLYQMHEVTRLREGLLQIDPNDESLRSELNSAKFTILRQRDAHGSAVAIFTAKLHCPIKSSKNQALKKKIHKNTLQCIVYQLDSALENVVTQRNGIIFIYNMSNSDYSNFDYELCQKILNLLKGAYPAKLKKVLIVSPPLWFRAPFHLLRLIVREKLRDRVWLLNVDQLKDHVAPEVLTPELGGTNVHDHQAWLQECCTTHKTNLNDLCDPASAETLVKALNNKPANNFSRRSSLEGSSVYPLQTSFGTIHINEDYMPWVQSLATARNNNSRNSKSDTHNYDESGMSLSQFIDLIRDKSKRGLGDEYEEIVGCERPGSFMVSNNPMNSKKNRYRNILCHDHTRVVLEPYDLPDDDSQTSDPMDYINANYVDGYRQPKAYISTQGPIETTFMDFWRMIWQSGCRVIVMVTLNIENEVWKCDRYWPSPGERVMNIGVYKIEFLNQEMDEDFMLTHMKLTNTRSEVTRDIWHYQFTSWRDFGVPATASGLLKFRESILKTQLDAMEMAGGATYPPIVVHCSAGVGRSGTFIAIDICIQKLETTGLVDVKRVVEKLRQQRYSSIQTREQYTFCYKAVVEYAASCGFLKEEEIDDLF